MQVLTDRYYIFEDKASDPEEGIYLGYAASLGDVYTRYITKSDYEQMQEDDSGLYCGIGAMLQQDMNTGIMTVVRPFKGSPAEEAGLQTDDILYKVDGEDITALNLDIVVSKYIRGEEGTEVEITVYRGTDLEELTFTITRRQIETPIVEYEMKEDNIGYLSISEFNLITAEQYRKAIDDLTAQGMEGLIIDLRDNGGGIVDTAVEMLDYTLPDGLYTYLVDKQNGRTDFSGSDGHKVEVPIVLLVNGNTASSSEIFTGAMMDYDYATVVGTKTFGKGIVQYEIPLGDGSAFNITAAKYYTPNGVNIHGVGLEPDINVPKGENFKIMTETDNQYAAAVEELKKLK